ncbi:MAG: DEAD/DEAH box helicase [Candidatus Xenobiia bacterium LiM19]
MDITADSYREEYHTWALFIEQVLSDVEDSFEISWPQLQLFLIDAADNQCSLKLRSGRDDIFADISELFALFKEKWHKLKSILEDYLPDYFHLPQDIQEDLIACIFHQLIDSLTINEQIFYIHDRHRIRSNVYELIFYLQNLRQRMNENDPLSTQPRLTHMIKIESLSRERPLRDIDFIQSIREFLRDLELEDFAAEDWAHLRKSGFQQCIIRIWSSFLGRIGIEKIAAFQWRSFKNLLKEVILKRKYSGDREPYMIVAGTGFGKTEAFLFPVLFFSLINLIRKGNRKRAGTDAIFLYPRIDLCNNQLERCLWYIHCLRESIKECDEYQEYLNYYTFETLKLKIAVAHSGIYRDENHPLPFEVQCPICASEKRDGRIKLKHEQADSKSSKPLPYCTDSMEHRIDEYLTLGLDKNPEDLIIAITTVDTLHRRLMDRKGLNSLWKNRDMLPQFIVLDEIHIYEGQQGSHVANLMRRLKAYLRYIPSNENTLAENPYPPLLIGASATVGNPTKVCSTFFATDESRIKERIIKAQEGESIPQGREYIIILKIPPPRFAPVSNDLYDISENEKRNSRFVSEQATFLQSLMVLWHCMKKTPEKYRFLAFVDSIDSVWRIAKHLNDAEYKKILFGLRLPIGRTTVGGDLCRNHYCPKIDNKNCGSPPHLFFNSCCIYNNGECWWTMCSSSDIFVRPMRVLANSSGQREDPDKKRKLSINEWDCLVTTSTLEVGFDHPQLIATAQFKAPPSAASFQQRKGRGGRGIKDTPISLVVLGNSCGDQFAFRQEKRFFCPSDKELEIRVDPQNPFVRRHHTLSAIFDFFSWKGITGVQDQLYKKCDLGLVIKYLDKPDIGKEAEEWIYEVYKNDGISLKESKRYYQDTLNFLKNSIPLLHRSYGAYGIYNTLELFQKANEIQDEWIFRIKSELESKYDASLEQDLKFLEAAKNYGKKRSKYFYLHPTDYFSNLPLPRKTHIVPENFIPEPIGGFINVKCNNQAIEIEPRLQMLSNFLPGGFKNRWGFKLWYGTWDHVPDQHGNRNYADISRMCGTGHYHGALNSLSSNQQASFISNFLGPDAVLIEPFEIAVFSGKEHFKLNTKKNRVVLTDEAAYGPELSREPGSSIQSIDILSELKNEENKNLHIEGDISVFSKVTYCSLRILRLFYANIVTCYLKKNEGTHGTILWFWDNYRNKPAVPVVPMNSQGILIEGFISLETMSRWSEHLRKSGSYEEHYWRRIYRSIWRELLLGEKINDLRFPNSFACLSLLQALKFMDYQSKIINNRPLKELNQSEYCNLYTLCSELTGNLDVELFKPDSMEQRLCRHWEAFNDVIFGVEEMQLLEEIAESYSLSWGKALSREIALVTNTNIDMIQIVADVKKNVEGFSISLSIFDNIEGGNGTVFSYLQKVNSILSFKDIAYNHSNCITAETDEMMIDILTDEKMSADLLYSQCINIVENKEVAFKLKRLLASPSITAFYQSVAENVKYLRAFLKRIPTPEEVAISLKERPPVDPRGLALLNKFSIMEGGVAELLPKIQEIIPICAGSCPDCLGDSRPSLANGGQSIADRNLILE